MTVLEMGKPEVESSGMVGSYVGGILFGRGKYISDNIYIETCAVQSDGGRRGSEEGMMFGHI